MCDNSVVHFCKRYSKSPKPHNSMISKEYTRVWHKIQTPITRTPLSERGLFCQRDPERCQPFFQVHKNRVALLEVLLDGRRSILVTILIYQPLTQKTEGIGSWWYGGNYQENYNQRTNSLLELRTYKPPDNAHFHPSSTGGKSWSPYCFPYISR